jgi:hypothetical protein
MTLKTLRLNDGFNATNPHLRDEVKLLQNALLKAGYSVDADGFFGEGTEKVVKQFQKDKGLTTDGVVGKGTWSKLGVKEEPVHIPDGVLVGFRGNLKFIHDLEGHRGYPYWPGGSSGVTIDPGFDLGQVEPDTFKKYYEEILSSSELNELNGALGIKGNSAKRLLDSNPHWKNIKVSRSEADIIFPIAADQYWIGITKRYPALKNADTPGSVQTAFLSLAYNRGIGNKGIDVLASSLNNKKWTDLANLLAEMQQDHKLKGIRIRRKMEAGLIRNETA